MECLRKTGPNGDLRVTEKPIPEPGPNEVLIDVAATGVGLTVYNHLYELHPDDDVMADRIPGHELVGTVDAVGEEVTHLDPGDRVVGYYYLVCDQCGACTSGRHALCDNHRGNVGVDRDGGFAEYTVLPKGNAIPIPERTDPVDATVIPDALATPVHIVEQRLDVGTDAAVAILGAGGGVGIHLLQLAEHCGMNTVAVDRIDEKLAACRRLGAGRTVNTADGDLEAATAPWDAVVDFTGSVELVRDAIDDLASRGRVVHLTVFRDRTADVSPRNLVLGERELVGSRYCSKDEVRTAASLVDRGAVDPVVSDVVDLDGVPSLLRRIAEGKVVGRGAVRLE